MHSNLLQKEQFKTVETTGDLIGEKIADKGLKKFTTE